MDLDRLALLRTPDGVAALAAAGELAGGDPLAAAAALRSRGVDPELAAAALTQAELRLRARGKFGADAGRHVLHPRRPGAGDRGPRSPPGGPPGCAPRGCARWPTSAAASAPTRSPRPAPASGCTRWTPTRSPPRWPPPTSAALGLADRVEVRCADATEVDLAGVDAVFCDPARRRAGTGRRVVRPGRLLPALGLRRRAGRAGAPDACSSSRPASTTRWCRRARRPSG